MPKVSIERQIEAAGCQPWLECPYRLISWWAMEKFSAASYFAIARALESGMTSIDVGDHSPALFKEGGEAWKALAPIVDGCRKIGLSVSMRCLDNFVRRGQQGLKHSEVREFIKELTDVIQWEMMDKVFMYLPPERASRYALSEPLGENAHKSFPSISFDATEAGNCFASARFTGCVFHLMRVLEIGLVAFAKLFPNVPTNKENWQIIIEKIESEIRDMPKAAVKVPDWKEKMEQYAQIANSFMFFKDAWRNYTAHARGKYTEDEADSIYRNVRSFMQGLAKTGLHE